MRKYCSKCGNEIPSTSKNDVCESCQNKKNGKLRKALEIGGGGLLSIGLLFLTRGKFGGFKK